MNFQKPFGNIGQILWKAMFAFGLAPGAQASFQWLQSMLGATMLMLLHSREDLLAFSVVSSRVSFSFSKGIGKLLIVRATVFP